MSRIAIVTDAWHPQINGVVTTLTQTMRQLERAGHEVLVINPQRFFSIPCPTYPEIRLAIAGFGHGLVPEGVARTLGIRAGGWMSLKDSGLSRPVRFVARKSMFSRPLVQNFYQAVKELADDL